MTEKHDKSARGQLDNGWHIWVGSLMIMYVVVLLVANEAGLSLPEWMPAWVLALPPLAAYLWWVPLVMVAALLYLWRKISFGGFSKQ